MSCSICIQDYTIFDYIVLLECGHYFHNMCYFKSKLKKCPICRRLSEENISFCLSDTSFDFFDLTSEKFNKQARFKVDNRHISIIQESINRREIQKELIEKQKLAIDQFMKNNMTLFKFRVLSGICNKELQKVIYSSPFGEVFMDIPVIFLLNGPKKDCSYFQKHGIKSIKEHIMSFFDVLDVEVKVDYINHKNNVVVYFKRTEFI